MINKFRNVRPRASHVVAAVAMVAAMGGTAYANLIDIGLQTASKQSFVTPGTTQTFTVSCPAGKKVLGGGFSIESPSKVLNSAPRSDNKGWNVTVSTPTMSGYLIPPAVYAYAQCASVA